MTSPALIGWYVRVTTTEIVDGEAATELYVVGYLKPEEAEAAVKAARNLPNETYNAVQTALLGYGPQVHDKEIRELPGAK